MFRLKLDDANTLFANKEQQLEAQQSFPNDLKGDLVIKICGQSYQLQKNILGKNSAYFGQLATIKSLHMIEIANVEICPNILVQCLRILYGQSQEFLLNDLHLIYQTLNFLRAKEIKSCLIGQLKQIAHQNQQELLRLFQFAFEYQIMALSGYYTEMLLKNGFIQNFDLNYKANIQILSEKSLTVLLSSVYNQMFFEQKDQQNQIKDLEQQFYKIIEYFCSVKGSNLIQMKQNFDNLLSIKKEKLIQKEDQKKDVTQVAKELRDLKNQHENLNFKYEEMKKQEKKHQHIINNLTQKVKLLEKAIIYIGDGNEQIKNILKPKKKKKSEEKIIKLQNLIKQQQKKSDDEGFVNNSPLQQSLQNFQQNQIIQKQNFSQQNSFAQKQNFTNLQQNKQNTTYKNQEIPSFQFFNRNKEIQFNTFQKISDLQSKFEQKHGKDIQNLFNYIQKQNIKLIFDGIKYQFNFQELQKSDQFDSTQIILITIKNLIIGLITKFEFDKIGQFNDENLQLFKFEPFQIFQLKEKTKQNIIFNEQTIQFSDDIKIIKNQGYFQIGQGFNTNQEWPQKDIEIENIHVYCLK